MAFDFSQWAKGLPQEAQEQLVKHGFNTLSALLVCSENDIGEIISKQGQKKVTWDQIKRLQEATIQETTFDFDLWAQKLPSYVKQKLVDEALDHLDPLLLCTHQIIQDFRFKKGDELCTWEAIQSLQKQHRKEARDAVSEATSAKEGCATSVKESSAAAVFSGQIGCPKKSDRLLLSSAKKSLDSEQWAQNLPLHVKQKLAEEDLTSFDALLLCTHQTIRELGFKKADELRTWNAIRKLQKQHRPDARDLVGKERSGKEISAASGLSGQISSSGKSTRLLRTRAILAPDDHDEIRIVLIGKTGAGKSATGNAILGVSPKDGYLGFEECSGQASGTTECKTRSIVINGQRIRVIDTPGACDTHRDEREVRWEISKCLVYASPGPHVVLFVIGSNSRFTDEEMDAFRKLCSMFHTSLVRYMCVVFTNGESMEEGIDSLEKNIERSHNLAEDAKAQGRQEPDIYTILEQVDKRYLLFSNKADQDRKDEQVQKLLDMIANIKRANTRPYFSDDKTKKVAEDNEKRLKEIMAERNVERAKAWEIFLKEIDTATIKTVRGGAAGAGAGVLLGGIATLVPGGAALGVPLVVGCAAIGGVTGAYSKCSLM